MHAEALALAPEMSAEAALQRIGRACLDHLMRNEDAALTGDGEGIHQMRVAVRRLRAILSAFAPLLSKSQRRWASGQLRWFADVLGEARNLDVFATTLLHPARAALPAASEFERLAITVERHRSAAHKIVAEAILSARYAEAVLGLTRWFDACGWRAGAAVDNADLQHPIGEVAPPLLERCRVRVAKRSRHFARQTPRQRHRLRIALKRLRYAADLLGGLYDPVATKEFGHRLKRLQDDLGDINDVEVGGDIVAALAPAGKHATGIGLAGRRVLAWHKRRIKTNEPELRAHLGALVDAPPFWHVR